MKKAIVVLFLTTLSFGARSQIERNSVSTTDWVEITIITPAEKNACKDAERLFIMFLRILEGIPKNQYSIGEVERFVSQRFTDDSYIEIRQLNGDKQKREPSRYFRNLIGRYFGAAAKFDSSSEIRCNIRIQPRFVMRDGQRTLVCNFTQYMIDRKNGRQMGPIDKTSKNVCIIFETDAKLTVSKISHVEVVESN